MKDGMENGSSDISLRNILHDSDTVQSLTRDQLAEVLTIGLEIEYAIVDEEGMSVMGVAREGIKGNPIIQRLHGNYPSTADQIINFASSQFSSNEDYIPLSSLIMGVLHIEFPDMLEF